MSSIDGPGAPPPPPPPPPPGGQMQPVPYLSTSTNGMAIASLVLGIVFMCGIGSILALIFGYMARSQIDESGGTQSGRGMAIAGIVLGWIGVGLAILYLLIWIVAIAASSGS